MAENPKRGEEPADRELPGEVLGDVWDALDVLPAARSTPSLATTTIEMAAVSLDGPAGAATASPAMAPVRPAVEQLRWVAAGVIVAACLAAGFVTGSAGTNRITPRPPELAVVIRHLETLEEAGSVAFLEAFAEGDYTPPMFGGRDGPRRGRPDAGDRDGGGAEPTAPEEPNAVAVSRLVEAPELEAAIADFRRAFVDGLPVPLSPASPEEMHGEMVDDMLEMVQQFEMNRLTYSELPPSQRESLVVLAEALADPQRSDLLEAARLWHAWVTFADPVERAGLIALPSDERLEWLDRRMRQWRRFLPGRGAEAGRPEGSPPPVPAGPPPGGRGGGGRGPAGPPRRGPDSSSRVGEESYGRFGGGRGGLDENAAPPGGSR